jgi:hypothetical protein
MTSGTEVTPCVAARGYARDVFIDELEGDSPAGTAKTLAASGDAGIALMNFF